MHSKIIEPLTILFNNYLMTLQPNLHLGLWNNLIIYELHYSSKIDNGWMVFSSQNTWHITECNTSVYMAPMAFACWGT